MLVLSRRANESIVIDGRITVTVVGFHGNRIRLGVEAPRDVPVFRKELVSDETEEAEHTAGSCAA